ncbi:hypothetical protein BKA70DRAFT_1205478 [Coprinopsis sp. MPI-PUGE-AT-0042]|nr:hypothetical protein BKA70DRAFT_1205478 [Coprinopsis sp. MPI-PUGE-AT-0042]
MGLREEIPTHISGSTTLALGDSHSIKQLPQVDQTSSVGKQEESQVEVVQTFHEVRSTGSANVASGDTTPRYHGNSADVRKAPLLSPPVLAKDSRPDATVKSQLRTPSKSNAYTSAQTQLPPPTRPKRSVAPVAHGCTPAELFISSDGTITVTDMNKPDLFPAIQRTLKLMMRLVDSPAGSANIFHRISPDIRDLVQLIAFASTAHQACNGQTAIERLIQSAIDSGISRCNRKLVALHKKMLILPHRRIPLVGSVCQTIYQSWTANEPEEITLIRSKLNAEVRAFGEWLACLKSLYWASQRLFSAKTRVSWKDLELFFKSGPVLLKEMHVDKIVIMEPLQGSHLSVPIRFVSSFEDVHHIIQFAFQGIDGTRYLEGQQYQLEDSNTNRLIDPSRFAKDCLKDGKAFEVAIKLVQMDPIGLNVCPQCTYHHQDEEDNINGWIRCRACKTQFNARDFGSAIVRQVEVDSRNTPDAWTASPAANHTILHHVQGQSKTQNILPMFRRLIVEAPTLDIYFNPTAANHNALPHSQKQRGYRICDNCGVPETPAVKFRLCGGCMSGQYCSQDCQRAHWPSHKPICQHIGQQAPKASALTSSADTNEDIVKSLRKFTSAHASLLSWAGFQALQLKQVPANIRKSALLVELSPREHADSHRRFSVSAAHIVPRNYIRDPDVVADIQRREERCRQSGGIGTLIVILQYGGVAQVTPFEVDPPPSKISWDERTDWHAVLNHFVESGRTDFKPISTSSRGVYYG